MPKNIYPIIDQAVSRQERELQLKQRSIVIWFTGLSGSGKSTLAIHLERALFEAGYFAKLLDGDNIRSGINTNLGFSLEERQENIRRVAEVAKLFKESGAIVLCTFISPTATIRNMAKAIINEEDFFEVFVDASLEVCETRDVKGLYAKARRGEIQHFTGIDSPYEIPEQAALTVKTSCNDIESCINQLMNSILPMIKLMN